MYDYYYCYYSSDDNTVAEDSDDNDDDNDIISVPRLISFICQVPSFSLKLFAA